MLLIVKLNNDVENCLRDQFDANLLLRVCVVSISTKFWILQNQTFLQLICKVSKLKDYERPVLSFNLHIYSNVMCKGDIQFTLNIRGNNNRF